MNKVKLSVLVGFSLSLICIIGFSSVYPKVNDLWVENQLWNGLSSFYVFDHPVRLDSLIELETTVNPSGSTLFIIGPYQDFTGVDAESIIYYLGRGGTLVLMEDFGSGNQLLSLLGLEVRFDSRAMFDPIFRERNSVLPRVMTIAYPTVEYIVLNYPTVLTNVDPDLVTVWSSPVSYLLSNIDEESKSYSSNPVVAEIPYENGQIVLISDSSIFINDMIEKGDNQKLLECLSKGSSIIDESHILETRLSRFQGILTNIYGVTGFYEIRYVLTLGVILLIFRINFMVQEQRLDPVEEVMSLYPEYDRKIVEWLDRERGKIHE